MSDDSSDGDPCCEWTLVSGDGEIIEEDEPLKVAENVGDELQYEPPALEKGCEIQEEDEVKDAGSSITESEITKNLEELFWRSSSSEVADIDNDDDSGHSDTSSDIEKLDEQPALEVSYHSDLSKFSDLQPLVTEVQDEQVDRTDDEDNGEHSKDSLPLPGEGVTKPEDQLDLSDNSSLQHELPNDLNINCIRSYRHTPNQQLNVTLNMLLALSITTVLGLGIGHFVGWSSQWLRQNHIQQSQIVKLKMLQDELVTCLQRQHLEHPLSEELIDFSYYKPCFEQAEYWRHQFNEMLSENDDLRDIVMDKNQGSYCRELTEIGDEYQNMKLHLLHKQLDHIETLKQFEMVKQDERDSREQVKYLQNENHDLKTKLDTGGVGEAAEDQRVMCHLMKENTKLRLALHDLQPQIPEDDVAEPKDDIIQVEVGSLRQKINQLQMENEDLRQVIARLRYGKPPAMPITDAHQNKLNQLESENTDLKVEIGKIRYGKPPEISIGDRATSGENLETVIEGEVDNAAKTEDGNVVVLQEEIKKLQNAFDVEKNQTLKWKELYEALTRDTPVDERFKAWIQDNILSLDVSKFFEVLKSKGVHSREFLELLKQKNGEWLDKLWVNMSRATDLLLNKVQETRQQMEEYVHSDQFHLKSGKKLVKKMSKVLSNTMNKFKDATKNLIPEKFKKSSAKAATKLVDKINGLVNHLNTKWSEITSDLELNQKTTTTDTVDNSEEATNNFEDLSLDNSEEASHFEDFSLDNSEETLSEFEARHSVDIPLLTVHDGFDTTEEEDKNSHVGNEIAVDEKRTLTRVEDAATVESVHNASSNLQEPKNGKPKQNDYKHSRSSNDSIGKQGKDKSKHRWTRERRDAKKVVREVDADWVFRRAQYRENKKLQQQKADWLFDRARDRAEQRQVKVGIYRDGKPQTDWFFERARERERSAGERQAKYAVLKDWWFERAQDREDQRRVIKEGAAKPPVMLRYQNYDDNSQESNDFEEGILVEDDEEDLVYKTSLPAVHYRTQYYAAQHHDDDDSSEEEDDDDDDDDGDNLEARDIRHRDEARNEYWHFNDELIKVPCDVKKNFPALYRTEPRATVSHDDRKTYKHPEKETKKAKSRNSNPKDNFKTQVHHSQTFKTKSQFNCGKNHQKNFSRGKDCSSNNAWKVEQNRQFYRNQNGDRLARSERQCCEYDSTNHWDKGWKDENVFHRTVVSCNC